MDPITPPVRLHLSDKEAAAEARRILDDAYRPTSYRDDTLPSTPTIGTTPPVPQPGRPAMSQGATDASMLMLAGGASASMVGLTAAVLMYVSQYADPVVCGIAAVAPTTLVLALSRLVGRVKETVEAAPPEIHNHYEGDVYQEQHNVHTDARGLVVKNSTSN